MLVAPAPWSRRSGAVLQSLKDDLCAILADLYARQLAVEWDEYLLDHSRPRIIRGQVQALQRYLPYLPAEGTLLDWGCRHAPDSCLLRAIRGDAYELHGCDFPEPGRFAEFHDYAGLNYRQLEDHLSIPYADASFDIVIGSGTLEHTAMDYESLKEVHRVLKPDGTLVITYLPNALSVAEFKRRNVLKKPCHRRLYRRREMKQLLLHTGFDPVVADYQCWFWEKQIDRVVTNQRLADALAVPFNFVLPVRHFSSVLFAVARKVNAI